MGFNIVVTVKQVPDTHNVSGNAMKEDGTINRSALPAIFNPEDLNALEEALKIKKITDGNITAITMGPASAVDILKECLYRGVDKVILVSDKKFAGSDTLATSYILKSAIEKNGNFDLILCGRQAIDGDTAQVGPQIAEKLDINQITNIFQTVKISKNSITVKRETDTGAEIVKSRFPVLLTVTSDTNEPRPPSVKLIMTYKKLKADDFSKKISFPDISAEKWNINSINAEESKCGFSGSPTKVVKVDNVVLTTGRAKMISNTDDGINTLFRELNQNHVFG